MESQHSNCEKSNDLLQAFSVENYYQTKLGVIDRDISSDLFGFLRQNIVPADIGQSEIESDFVQTRIPEAPYPISEYTDFVMDKLVANSVNVSAPGFVGHMATPIPYFMLPLAKIMIALNQNMVKTETSKSLSPLERQVLAMLHKLIFRGGDDFYAENTHTHDTALGAICSGGTVANISALWVARNRLLSSNTESNSVSQNGLMGALRNSGFTDLAILASERAHYSLGKAADVLGIGSKNLIKIPTDASSKIDITKLDKKCRELTNKNIGIISIVGIAGSTETGSIDPLSEMAAVSVEHGAHFHIDAAWGGPTLLSEKHKSLLSGIEKADSVTIDAHKQLYVPMGAGMVLFRNPYYLKSVQHNAEYILRSGSKDSGQFSLEGSRPGFAMLVHAALHLIGRRGFGALIDRHIEITKEFAQLVKQNPNFQLESEPVLNILNYRYVPPEIKSDLQSGKFSKIRQANMVLDRVTEKIQKLQRSRGETFVSRTRLPSPINHSSPITVFRAVFANPMTTSETLKTVLNEQENIGRSIDIKTLYQ